MNTIPGLAASITRSASQQTYYTIRFLADRDRVEDAYRAYAYFRWVDDSLDAEDLALSGAGGAVEARERSAFIQRQKSLLEECYRGGRPQPKCPQESLLVELVRHDDGKHRGLRDYLHNMMAVMEFDAARRGRLISQAELNQYTLWLASAVTEAMHYFIGHCCSSPHDETRYLAVSAAHITHMLRDLCEDVQAGYYNIPIEVLEAHHIQAWDVESDAYRAWVRSRVQMARSYFKTGREYLNRVENARCRFAGLAYTARFEWILDTIEREGYLLRPRYEERKSLSAGMWMSKVILSSMINSDHVILSEAKNLISKGNLS